MNQKEFNAVLELPANIRYEYFIKKIVDQEVLWGLYDDGWALSTDDVGNHLFPFWPRKEFAEYCAIGDWSNGYPMKNVYLVRHCQAIGQEPEASLSERGREDAEGKIVDFFMDQDIEFISSPWNRAIETIGPLLLSLILKHYKQEFGFKEWKNLSNPDIYHLEISQGSTNLARVW